MQKLTYQTLQVFWDHSKKYPWHLLVIILAVALGSAIYLVTPYLYKQLIDALVSSYQGEAAYGVVYIIYKNLILVLFLNIAAWVLWRTATFVNNYFQPQVMKDLSETCFDYLHLHSHTFFSNRFVGGIVRKVGRLVSGFEAVSDAMYWNLVPMVVRISAILIIITYNFSKLGYILMSWTAVYLVINYFMTMKKMRYDSERARADSEVTAYLADTITNNNNVKLFTAYEYEKSGFRLTTHKRYSLTKFSWDFDATIESVQSGFMVILEFLIFWFAVQMWQSGKLSVGDFVLLQAYLLQVFDRLWDFGRVVRKLYNSVADAQEMVEILIEPHQIVDQPNAKKMIVTAGEVDFRNVRFHYANNLEVIKSLNLKVKPGEKVGLVGPSGAGKSTLSALIFRLHDLTSGGIYIDNQNIAEVAQESLRENISLVPQEPILFHRSLIENIRYGKRSATDEEVYEAARLAHCHEFINKMPEGYNTFVGERGIKLSGGERQRVAIARAILKNAPILVLDEATSSLDSETEHYIQDALNNLMVGKTTIVIAHRLSTIMKMDRIIVLNDGQIQETGNHDELLKKNSGIYQKLWQLQAGGFLAK